MLFDMKMTKYYQEEKVKGARRDVLFEIVEKDEESRCFSEEYPRLVGHGKK